MSQQEAPRELLTVPEVSTQLRVCRSTVYNLLNSHELRSIRIGRRTLIARAERDRVLIQRQSAA